MTEATSDPARQWLPEALDTDPAGIIVLSAAGSIAASNARSLELLACANVDELRALCQPILKRLSSGLPRDGSPPVEHFELQIGARPQPRKVAVSAHPLGSSPMQWLLLMRSDAAARRFEGLLEHAARNQLLERLYGTMRHDLHSPIQAVLWSFDLLQKAAQQAHVSPDQRAQLEESAILGRKELDRLKASVRRFLSFAMPVPVERERVDLAELAQAVQRVISAEASLFEVKVTVQEPAQPLTVEGVRGQLEQAIAVLMLNAVDAIPMGGTVNTVIRESDGRVEVLVSSSTGQPHTRSLRDPASPPRLPIGLQAVRAVAASHGGDISELPGNGTRTFRLRLSTTRPRNPSV